MYRTTFISILLLIALAAVCHSGPQRDVYFSCDFCNEERCCSNNLVPISFDECDSCYTAYGERCCPATPRPSSPPPAQPPRCIQCVQCCLDATPGFSGNSFCQKNCAECCLQSYG